MADAGFLPKEKVKEFLAGLAKDAIVYAPCREGDAVTFRPFGPGCDLCLDSPATTPPKAVIYPQSETLFSFTLKKDADDPQRAATDLEVMVEAPAAVVFGARPCDARGFTVYDRVFLDTDTADPYYRERRARTTIVTIVCPSPFTGCFCTGVGGSAVDREGSDVVLTEVGKGYYIEAVTEKGKVLLQQPVVTDGAPYREEAERVAKAAGENVPNPFGPEGPKIAAERFASDAFWGVMAGRCISCGACTFVCPTCYCFNITDEQGVRKGERIRSWDACMFQHFTLETSGHNPRPRKEQRYRNRVGHKFLWYPEKYSGNLACTGCGRCVRHCPVSIDIREVVSSLEASDSDAGTAAGSGSSGT